MSGGRARLASTAGVAALALLAVAVLTLANVREQRKEVVCSRARSRSCRGCTAALLNGRKIETHSLVRVRQR